MPRPGLRPESRQRRDFGAADQKMWNAKHLLAAFFSIPLCQREGVKKLIFTEDERGYWRSFRAVPFCRELLTMKNLSYSRSPR